MSPWLSDSGPPLHAEEYRLLRDAINGFCGIALPEDYRFVTERRLRERLRALNLDSYTAYYHYLRYHPHARSEIERVVDILTTNETYFFREEYQLETFRREILPALRERADRDRSKRLALWSAGCSTGEEVYTLAMLVADSGLFLGWDVRIFGNDISRQVLQRARNAVYSPSSFRVMPQRYAKYFTDVRGGKQVVPKIRAMCHFGYLNLLDSARAAIVGKVQAVFCRNVLIYFDMDSRQRVLDTLYQRLEPGGYLFLGHSESLLNASTAFELVHLPRDLVYRRPEGARKLVVSGEEGS